MADPRLGQKLIDAGWEQGAILPKSLQCSVIYRSDEPVTRMARAAQKELERKGNSAKGHQDSKEDTSSPPSIGIAHGSLRAQDRLIIASQTCDILRSLDDEPTVLAMRLFASDDPKTLVKAKHSHQFFLLDANQGLIVQADMMTRIEKPVLSLFQPENILSQETKRDFAQWVASRFTRVAFDEEVVGAVIRPILNNLRSMDEADNPLLSVLGMIKEIRVAHLSGLPPYDVRLLFIVPESGLPDNGQALDRLVGNMKGWFDARVAQLVGWEATDVYGISVGDYLSTDKIDLDHYTYHGRTYKGIAPVGHLT